MRIVIFNPSNSCNKDNINDSHFTGDIIKFPRSLSNLPKSHNYNMSESKLKHGVIQKPKFSTLLQATRLTFYGPVITNLRVTPPMARWLQSQCASPQSLLRSDGVVLPSLTTDHHPLLSSLLCSHPSRARFPPASGSISVGGKLRPVGQIRPI